MIEGLLWAARSVLDKLETEVSIDFLLWWVGLVQTRLEKKAQKADAVWQSSADKAVAYCLAAKGTKTLAIAYWDGWTEKGSDATLNTYVENAFDAL